MALTDYIEINIANNAELHTNVQCVYALMCATRPVNIFIIYNLKQKEFKV